MLTLHASGSVFLVLVRGRLGFSSCEASKMLTLHASGLGFRVQDLGYRV